MSFFIQENCANHNYRREGNYPQPSQSLYSDPYDAVSYSVRQPTYYTQEGIGMHIQEPLFLPSPLIDGAYNDLQEAHASHGQYMRYDPYDQNHAEMEMYNQEMGYYDDQQDDCQYYEDAAPPATHDENTVLKYHIHPQPRTITGAGRNDIRLRPVSDLPDIYRTIFKFGVFNIVQSTCFNKIMYSDENIVVSAPTGSGKTVLFELAIIRMLHQSSLSGNNVKCIYIAPTKALCSERQKDWTAKFQGLGIKCCELTGDTVTFGRGMWGDAKSSNIIVTTCEKWDSLTRNWEEHPQILSQITLLLVDEVHILNDTRGSTLEVVISRTKARGSAIRLMMVSATVPNIGDVAQWVGEGQSSIGNSRPATIFDLGEEYRPCKLIRHVIGIRRPKEQNDFSFAHTLDSRLFSVLQKHSTGKPVLIFAPTRKGCVTTAKQLAKDYAGAASKANSLPWHKPQRADYSFRDHTLAELAMFGIGVHHAGLDIGDKGTVEELFRGKKLKVLVCTSTLAVGVNLPAHMVIIKGVSTYKGKSSCEYSELEIMQMMGRAGRPPFDTEGVAIILCESHLEAKYRQLTSGNVVLESTLHRNLAEHLNSEIGLGTITNMTSARSWIRRSFLFQRIQKNPRHYSIQMKEGQTWQDRIDELVLNGIHELERSELIRYDYNDESQSLSSTEYGDIMNKFYIKSSTMVTLMRLTERASLREILDAITSAEEFSDIALRSGEKTALNRLRQHMDIRFQLKKIEKASDKIFLLTQAVLGGISLSNPEYKSPESQLQFDALSIFRHISRLSRVVVEVGIFRKSGGLVKHGLELIRCLDAKSWEDRPTVLRQIEQIGEKSLKVLAENGIKSFASLSAESPRRLEVLLNRNPPFGDDILNFVRGLPQYHVSIEETDITTYSGHQPVEVELEITCGAKLMAKDAMKIKKNKKNNLGMTTILTFTSDLNYIDFRRIPTIALSDSKKFTVVASLSKPSQCINVSISSESIAGLVVAQSFKPKIDPKEYPTAITRLQQAHDLEIQDLEDNPNFWDDEDFDYEISAPPICKPHDGGSKPANVVGKSAKNVNEEPRKLPNGNWECHHICTDKSACRHPCCRNGLKKPPRKNRKTKDNGAQGSVARKNHTQASSDKYLKQLNSVHEATNVTNSLGLRQGQRITNNTKLTSVSSKSSPEKTSYDRTLHSDSNDPIDDTSYTPDSPMSPRAASDSDDLPDPSQLLQPPSRQKLQSHAHDRASSGEYSDSEFDHVLENIDFRFLQDSLTTSQPPINTLKRSPPSTEYFNSYNKRIKTDYGSYRNDSCGLDLTTSQPDSFSRQKESTQHPSRNGATPTCLGTATNFDFDLDMSAFEGLPPIVTLSRSGPVSCEENTRASKKMPPESSYKTTNAGMGIDGGDPFKEELDELDEFLNSSVVVTTESDMHM